MPCTIWLQSLPKTRCTTTPSTVAHSARPYQSHAWPASICNSVDSVPAAKSARPNAATSPINPHGARAANHSGRPTSSAIISTTHKTITSHKKGDQPNSW